MEPKPMTMWRGRYGVLPTRVEDTDEAVAVTPRADFDAILKERDEARRALSGHPFDGESLSLREAIRSEMLKDYVRALNDRDAATARADKAEALLRELLRLYRYEFSDDEVARIDALLEGKA